jgi:hypothetical protein
LNLYKEIGDFKQTSLLSAQSRRECDPPYERQIIRSRGFFVVEMLGTIFSWSIIAARQ